MSLPKICLICRSKLEPTWKFCLKCGARIDEDLLKEASSIDYLLGEVPKWHEKMMITPLVKEELIKQYENRKAEIIESLLPKAKLPQSTEEAVKPHEPVLPPAPEIRREPPIRHTFPAVPTPEVEIPKVQAP